MNDKTLKNQVLLGADPEYFLKKDGKFISAFGLLPGTKYAPTKVAHGATQIDGMAIEFNIDPAANEQEWLRNIDGVMSILKETLPDYDHVFAPVADFGLEYIRSQPEKAKELGCEPDYDAYTSAVNPRPNGELPFRSAAGHIHFGLPEAGGDAPVDDQDYIDYLSERVKELDFYLGLPSLLYDNDKQRRELYGKAGAFRPKKYGMEYRTLSNQWLSNEALKRWAYNASMEAMERINSGVSLFNKYGTEAQRIINTSNKIDAIKMIKENNILVPAGIVL